MSLYLNHSFVGRERELALMAGVLAHVVKGSGTAMSVVGEPGIGKSRLLSHFIQTACGGATVLFAQCHEDESPRAFGSIAQMLKQASELYGSRRFGEFIDGLDEDLALASPFCRLDLRSLSRLRRQRSNVTLRWTPWWACSESWQLNHPWSWWWTTFTEPTENR